MKFSLGRQNFACFAGTDVQLDRLLGDGACARFQTYLAARSKPVDESQEGQSDGHRKDHQKLHRHRLLP